MLYAISPYTGPCYKATQLYFYQTVESDKIDIFKPIEILIEWWYD